MKIFIDITVLIIISTIGMSIWLFYWNSNPYKLGEIRNSYTTTIANLDKILKGQIENIENNSSSLLPYSKDQMELYKNKLYSLKNPTLNQIAIFSEILPNRNVGFHPISNLSKPEDTLCMQLAQGNIGWYWCYGTLEEWSFIFYLIRIDLAPPNVLKNLNYKLGEGTVYFVSIGIGNPNEWHYSPYTVIKGEYSCIQGSQVFTGSDTSVSLSSDSLIINSSFQSVQNKSCKMNVTLKKILPAYLNAKNGCSPCIGGAGTNYWSYPAMNFQTDSLLSIGNDNIRLSKNDGIAWLDHQWLSSYPIQPMSQILLSIERIKKPPGSPLGKYIWLTLHIGFVHYMITAFPEIEKKASNDKIFSVILGVNSSINAMYTKYTSKNVTYNNSDCKLEVLEMTNPIAQKDAKGNIIGHVQFPHVYKIILGNNIYILDGKYYGECVTTDLTGNLHYSGSGILSQKNKQVGTGFMEANQFQNKEMYSKTTLSYIDLEDSYDNIQKMVLGKRAGLSIFILILWVILLIISLILLVISIIKLFKNFKK